jgi:chromosome segregation ATPase
VVLMEKQQLLDKISDFDNILKRNDALFKQTLDNDRAKIQQEVRTKLTRLKALEADKQELLRETSELVNQLSEIRKEKNILQQGNVDLQRKYDDACAELEVSSNTRMVLEKKLNDSTMKERDLQASLSMLENQHRSQNERLEQTIKESKKDAAAQVIDLTNQVRYLSSEVESLSSKTKDLDASEKKAWAEADRLRGEVDSIIRDHDRQQQQQAEEFATFKRENRDLKLKVSVMNESKMKSDMEIVSMQSELAKQENEIGNMADQLREKEIAAQLANENITKLTSELKTVSETYSRCRVRNIELEESMAKKLKIIEKQGTDISKLEREGVNEVKRLRMLLANTERELEEAKPQLLSLQKEANDGRSNFSKLQSSTNSTVNGLLDELRYNLTQ